MLVAFGITGWMMARRQTKAAHAVAESLRAIAAGQPTLPQWVATDEIGDLALATGRISIEMQHVFEQLRAMAAGDLGRDLQGDSGLLQTFRESRVGMLEMSKRMALLARGEPVDAGSIQGDLGSAFARLQDAFAVIVDQAQTIASGDLRKDVDIPGAIGGAMQRMTGNLRDVVRRTQSVSGEIGDIVVSLQSSVSWLSAATTEQVAAVTETANHDRDGPDLRCLGRPGIRSDQAGRGGHRGGRGGGDAAEQAVQSMNAISTLSRKCELLDVARRERPADRRHNRNCRLSRRPVEHPGHKRRNRSRARRSSGKGLLRGERVRSLAADSRKAASQIREIPGEIRERTSLSTPAAAGTTPWRTATS
jgi:HAMP domain-containing protein